jgi:hypothetical protein
MLLIAKNYYFFLLLWLVMVIIYHFELHYCHNGKFKVFPKASAPNCPCCGGQLNHFGWRERVFIYISLGIKRILIIRRFRCLSCKRIHHELPCILVPYKRHILPHIERLLDGGRYGEDASCMFPKSTAKHLFSWLYRFRSLFLTIIKSRQELDPLDDDCPIETLGALQSRRDWLKWLVFNLTNFREHWPRKYSYAI